VKKPLSKKRRKELSVINEAMGVRKSEMSDEKAGETAVTAIEELTKRIGLPGRLREVDVPKKELKDCAELSLSDGSIVYNPKPVFESKGILKVFEAAW